MSAATNKALFHRFLEEVANQGRLEVIDQLLAPDFVDHEELPPGVPAGLEGVKHYFSQWRQGFPDGQVTAVLEIAEDDLVVSYTAWRGTHQGEFLGMPPSGRSVEYKLVDIVRVADGRMVEHWAVSDNLALLTQIGAIPAAA
jgi:predicted ester cyclase